MKGFTKVIKRTPHMVTTKVGMSKKSADPEFEEYERHFSMLEKSTENLIKDTKSFTDNVNKLFESSHAFATHFTTIMSPLGSEYSLESKHPDVAQTIRASPKFESAMEELKLGVAPELELIETRIIGPVKEFQEVLKTVRKTITKRQHKLTDYDRFNNSLTKLRDKKEKSLSDEKNLFKLEQDFELATQEYDYINTALKNDMPNFMTLVTQFVDPLFHSFYFMQLQIYYLMLERITSFAEESKFDISNVPASQIQSDYEEKRSDAWAQIEDLNIVKRIISVSRLVQQQRAAGGGSSLSRAGTTASTASSLSARSGPPPSRTASTFSKKAPPPPPSSKFSASKAAASPSPPPYTPSSPPSAASALAAAKKAPPPPPPLKPKPSLIKKKDIVVALYDFDAQADGDLSFKTGDRIEIVQRSQNTEDWWTGRLERDGSQGVFPGNYVQDT